MRPRIQYVTTADGVQIAFSVTGSGPPLLWLFPIIANNLQLTFGSPIQRELFEALAKEWTLVMLDARGFGLSDEDVADMSLAGQLFDIEAVLDRLDIDDFVCSATELSVPAAVALAARHPGRVRRLVVVNPFVSFADFMSTPAYTAVVEVARRDRGMFLEAWATNTAGFGAAGAAGTLEITRGAYRPRSTARFFRAMAGVDLSEELALVKAPTLVAYQDGYRLVTPAMAREVVNKLAFPTYVSFGEPFYAESCPAWQSEISGFLRVARPTLAEAATDSGSVTREEGPSALQMLLTRREVEVLELVAAGRTNAEIASALVVSINTVERHITHLYGKIGARNKADATAYALRHASGRT